MSNSYIKFGWCDFNLDAMQDVAHYIITLSSYHRNIIASRSDRTSEMSRGERATRSIAWI